LHLLLFDESEASIMPLGSAGYFWLFQIHIALTSGISTNWGATHQLIPVTSDHGQWDKSALGSEYQKLCSSRGFNPLGSFYSPPFFEYWHPTKLKVKKALSHK